MNALVLTSSPAMSDCKIVSVETTFVLENFDKGTLAFAKISSPTLAGDFGASGRMRE